VHRKNMLAVNGYWQQVDAISGSNEPTEDAR
jgi:hypothetical protein